MKTSSVAPPPTLEVSATQVPEVASNSPSPCGPAATDPFPPPERGAPTEHLDLPVDERTALICDFVTMRALDQAIWHAEVLVGELKQLRARTQGIDIES